MIDIKQKTQFQVEPWFEVFFALQAITDADSRIHEVWKRQALLKLPQTFHKKFELIGASPYIWPSVADLLLDIPLTVPFEDRLSALRRISSKNLQKILFEGIFHEVELVKQLLSGKFDLNQTITQVSKMKHEWLAFIGLYPPKKNAPLFKGLEMLLRTPREFLS
jgi:hypothetical protein